MELSPYIFVNLTSAVCCFFFLLFLFTAYFTKKNMDNIENKIYRIMLIFNLLTVFGYSLFYTTDIIAATSQYTDYIYPLVFFFSKIAPSFLIVWYSLLLVYLIIIVNEKNEKFGDVLKKLNKNLNYYVIIEFIIILVLNLMEVKTINLKTGLETKMLLVNSSFLYSEFVFVVFYIIYNRKRIPKRKTLPFFLIIPLAIFTAICGVIGIQIVFVFVIATAIDHLMYHTIENPDMKMIAQLELAKTQAEKSSNAKSEFLSSMSHEIRTPLNAIVGLIQMIKESDDLSEVKEDSDDILIASQNLLDIVNGILDINKLESHQMEVQEIVYKPKDVIDSIIKMIRIRIGDKPIELRTYYDESISSQLCGDPEKIKQIITNLLTNAIKYTDKGFIDFNVEGQIIKDKCTLIISVKDTGRGISEEQKENLFEKFNRLDSDKDSDISGTGLGLAITKSLIELMDGKIEVESILGQGSLFKVTLTQKIFKNNDIEELL